MLGKVGVVHIFAVLENVEDEKRICPATTTTMTTTTAAYIVPCTKEK